MGGDLTAGTVKGDAGRLPVPRLALGRRRPVRADPLRPAGAARARGPGPGSPWSRTGSCSSGTTRRATRRRRDVTIPRIEGAFSAEWSDWTWDSILVEGANCREVIDNVVDMAHFFYIHFAFPTYFKNVLEGHIATQYLRTRARPDIAAGSQLRATATETTLRSEASYFGPSYMINYLWHDYHGTTIESVLINCHYPVTPTSFMLQWGVIVKRPAGPVRRARRPRSAAKFAKFIGLGFQQDVEIWRHKTRIDNPLLCAEDGPVYQLRRWYEQFYTDVADITPDMVARYEFEVDTTRARAELGGRGGGEPRRAAAAAGAAVAPCGADRAA